MRYILLALTLTGCGIGNAIKSTNSVPSKLDTLIAKMDEMNGQVKDTNAAIDETNGKLDQTNARVDETNAKIESTNSAVNGAREEIRGTNGKIDNTNGTLDETRAEISETNDSVHKQILLLSLTEMTKPENTAYLAPPLAMMAPGQVFAEEATADDIVKLAYLYFTQIQQIFPDEGQANDDGTFPPEVIKKSDQEKFIKLTVIQVIAGLAPQKTIEAMIDSQIVKGGRYPEAAYGVLMMRALFIKQFLLDADLTRNPLTTIGKIQEAVNHLNAIESILALPFREKIAFDLTGMMNPENNQNFTLELIDTERSWQKINRSFDTDLDPAFRQLPQVAELRRIVAENLRE